MADVYPKAHSVIVWLGAEDEYTPTVAETAHILRQSHGASDEFLRKYLYEDNSNLLRSELLQSLASNVSVQQREATIMLLCRPWFSRLWVIQEICLAHDIRLFCGRTEFSWHTMIHLAYSSVVSRGPYVRNGEMNYLGIEDEYLERSRLLETANQLCRERTLFRVEVGLFDFRVYEHQLCAGIRGQILLLGSTGSDSRPPWYL